MEELKKIVSNISRLIIDILLFGYNTTKQIILPGRRKKGNLFSSLFIFFVGIIERIGNFEHGVFRMANLLKQKYIKHSLLIVAGLLFLLSSIEWSGDKNINTNSGNYIAQFSDAGVKKINLSKQSFVKEYSETTFQVREYPAYKNILQSSVALPSSVKTFLLIRSIRI